MYMLTSWISQNEMWLLWGFALLISSIGFYRPLYFINIGYAFAIVAMVVVTAFLQAGNFTTVPVLQNAFLMIWGLRLGLYLVRREFQAAYRKRSARTHQRFAGLSWALRIVIWIGVSILYVLMFTPSLFRVTSSPVTTSWLLYISQGVGLFLMAGGLLLETVADRQKAKFKTANPRQYCDVGLYRWVRCPNYFGEIVFWVGNWVVGLVFYGTLLHWVLSTVGVLLLVLIMMGSTKRLEKTQNEQYGDRPEYQQYIRTVPVLFPFVPLYSLKELQGQDIRWCGKFPI